MLCWKLLRFQRLRLDFIKFAAGYLYGRFAPTAQASDEATAARHSTVVHVMETALKRAASRGPARRQLRTGHLRSAG
jgi:hypothetical protein